MTKNDYWNNVDDLARIKYEEDTGRRWIDASCRDKAIYRSYIAKNVLPESNFSPCGKEDKNQTEQDFQCYPAGASHEGYFGNYGDHD